MDKLKELKAAHQQCVDQMQAMLDKEGDLTAKDQTTFDELQAQAESLVTKIANQEALLAQQQRVAVIQAAPEPSMGRQAPAGSVVLDNPIGAVGNPPAAQPVIVPARCRRWSGRLNSFHGPDADVRAYTAGMFLAATLCNAPQAKQFCRDHGIALEITNLHQEGVNTQGGYLVYPEFENDIIRLVEDFGLARRKLRKSPMASDVKNRPRRTGGLTAYFVGEGSSITESTGTWDNVKLVAKKLAAITTASNELVSDAIIAIADEITREIALAFATKEDLCAFQGDGTSTYGGITGITQQLADINGVDDGGGLILGSGNLFSEIVHLNFNRAIAALPNYPGIQPEWYISKPAWAATMQALMDAAAGNTLQMLAETGPQPLFKGYPVNWTSGTSVMPVADANSQIFCLFGDLRMAADFGDRAGMTIAISTEAYVGSTSMFDTDSFAIRGVERFDINAHDCGSATVAGPVIGIISAAS